MTDCCIGLVVAMADEEDFRAGPLADRLVSAKWRVRSFAYEDLKKLFDEALEDTSGVFTKYGAFVYMNLEERDIVVKVWHDLIQQRVCFFACLFHHK